MKKGEKKWTRVICFLLCMMLTCGTFTTGASAAEIKNSQQISSLNLTVGKLLSQKMFNITMGKGQAINLLNIKGMTRVKISYRSSNNKVVAVNSKGVIKGGLSQVCSLFMSLDACVVYLEYFQPLLLEILFNVLSPPGTPECRMLDTCY